eukprot:3939900-Pyramimonas_sp.AAC.1
MISSIVSEAALRPAVGVSQWAFASARSLTVHTKSDDPYQAGIAPPRHPCHIAPCGPRALI